GEAFGLTLGLVGGALVVNPATPAPRLAESFNRRRAVLAAGLAALGAFVSIGAVRRIVNEMHQAAGTAPPAVFVAAPTIVPIPSATSTATPPATSTARSMSAHATTGATVPTATPPPTPVPTATPVVISIPAEVVPAITPNETFYVVSKNFVDPTLDADDWSLTIDGLVDTPLTITYTDIVQLPAVSEYVTLECISNPVGGKQISSTLWTGVPLATLLSTAGVQTAATTVAFTSADNYVESYPIEIAASPTTLLVHTMNGEPLPYRHGYPLRLLSTGHYGMKNPKWLRHIELNDEEVTGYWSRRGWNPNTPVTATARIDTPASGATVPLGSLAIGGVAFVGDRGIASVEVSADDGATWFPAEIEPPLSGYTWMRWGSSWTPSQPGQARLRVRVVEQDGTPQIADTHVPFPDGATGYHSVKLTIK
ncbi:MAG: molybdopterin-dependent oxidoreductase, partial [Thermomicrobiales bacterium]